MKKSVSTLTATVTFLARGPMKVKGVLITIGALALMIPLTSGSGPAAADASICGTSFNPYAQDAATLQSCGIPTYPLMSKVTAGDGSTTYTYNVEGDQTTYTVPPAGFNFATATAAQLAEYGVPPTAQLSNLSIVPPPSSLVSIPAVRAGDSPNWAGWSTSSTSNTFNTTSVYSTPNDLGSSRCDPNSVLFWTGLGGWNSGNLAQDGWGQNTPGLGQLQAWTQVLPTQGTLVPQNLTATVGAFFYMYVHHGGAQNNQFSLFMQNDYTGASVNPVVTDSHYDGTTAESIAERPTVNGSYSNLSNFGTVPFNDASANGSVYPTYDDFPIYMYNGSTELAVPSGIGSIDGSFVVKQLSCN